MNHVMNSFVTGSFDLSPLLAQTEQRIVYEAAPLLPITAGWQALLVGLVVLLAIAFVVWLYWRDGIELPRGVTVTLMVLRIAAVIGLLLFFINPEKRTEQKLVKRSRVPILIDTSSSMGIRDRTATNPSPPSRMEQVVGLLEDGRVVDQLRQEHDVVVYRFDAQDRPTELITLPRVEPAAETVRSEREQRLAVQWRPLALAGFALAIGGLLVGGIGSIIRLRGGPNVFAWITLAGSIALIAGYVTFCYAHLQTPLTDPRSLLWGTADAREQRGGSSTSENATEEILDALDSGTDPTDQWLEEIATTDGESTRLGDALRYVVSQERGGPVASILLVTDGRRNEGIDVEVAMAAARDAAIPLVVLGAGSAEPLKNVSVAEVTAPKRVFPSDRFQVRGLIKSSNLGGESVQVRLISIDEARTEAEQLEGETTVDLMPDDSPVSVAFDVTRTEEGRRIYEIQVVPSLEDFDPTDNQRQAVVEVIERKNRVLLIAGGPTREYQFLRNQLFRDPEVLLDVWLQSAVEGVAQESDKMLDHFPSTRDEMYEYDCVLAFDPDWRELTTEECELLEHWVADQGGGLVIVAGPVFTPEWIRSSDDEEGLRLIRKLYPVSFFAQGTGSIRTGRFGGESPFPLKFSREGQAAEFLWLDDSVDASNAIWRQFSGVFGYYAVNEPKAGAVIYSWFSDPSTEFDGRLPIYMAGQFYGAGRVFFQASGEMWRLREVEVEAFERYYTRLVRWASQGRLQRDSTRGVLLVDQERCWIGDRVGVQAVLRDEQDQPLAATQVTATVLMPDRSTRELVLTALTDGARPGTFMGQLPVGDEGDYRISLLIPGAAETEMLTAELRADIPDRERDQAERNDPLLLELAERTGGASLIPLPLSADDSTLSETLTAIKRNDLESYQPGTTDEHFTRALMAWILGLVAGVLCLEWLTRRLHRLA